MTDRPILFSGPMVRAILDGRKTQTRRVLRIQSGFPVHNFAESSPEHYSGRDDDPASWGHPYGDDGGPLSLVELALWQYAVGDRLWVREAWRTRDQLNSTAPRDLPRSAPIFFTIDDRLFPVSRYRPGIHMPRWASRLTLVVTDVRVERLQIISEADAMAEGIERLRDMDDPGARSRPEFGIPDVCAGVTARDAYAALWDSLNAPRGFGWAVNPWVVAVTFTAHRANIDTLPERIAA